MDECVKFRHFCKEDENNARRNQKNLRKMTLTDKEIFEIERILDDLEIYVQSHIKERRVISAYVLKIRRLLKSGEQQIFYKDS